MKQILLLFISLIFFSSASAQSIERQTIASTGNYALLQGTLLRQTIGQPYNTKTSYGTGVSYSPGFQQKEVSSAEAQKRNWNVFVFPNPTTDFVHIETSTLTNDVTLRLIDPLGRVLLIETFEVFQQYRLDCSVFPIGQYCVTLTSADTKPFVAKIIVLE